MSNVRSVADYHANHAIEALKVLIESTPEGEFVDIPQTRQQLEQMRQKLIGIEHMKDSVAYIDYQLEQGDLGRVRFAT